MSHFCMGSLGQKRQRRGYDGSFTTPDCHEEIKWLLAQRSLWDGMVIHKSGMLKMGFHTEATGSHWLAELLPLQRERERDCSRER